MAYDACLTLARELGRDPDAVIEAWTERAAIREYEGGQPREAAERDALADVRAAFERLAAGERKGPRSAAAAAFDVKRGSNER